MEYGVVLVMLLAVAFAINSSEDHKYDNLQKEVLALKKIVFNMNVELDNVREKYDDIHEELREVRSGKQAIETDPVIPGLHAYNNPTRNDENRETTRLNKRVAAYTPTLHLSNVWNGSKAIGPKGEKGDSGPPGVQGVNGTSGLKGLKGDDGNPGITGPLGSKGNSGQKGDKGEIGLSGPKGDSSNLGTNGMKIGFSAQISHQTKLTSGTPKTLIFQHVVINFGSDYDSASGVFTCSVTGTYVVTWSLEGATMTYTSSSLMKNGAEIGRLIVAGTQFAPLSGSQVVLVNLSVGDRLYISATTRYAVTNVKINDGSTFKAFLLYR